MSVDIALSRSRRSLLTAAAGAAAATVVSAIDRAAPVRAGTDGDVVLGEVNTAFAETVIQAEWLTTDNVLRLVADEGRTALVVRGKVKFNRSGRATILAGRSSVDIDFRLGPDSPWYGLEGTPLCFANLMSYRPGVFVTTVRPNYPIAGKMRIYLNRTVNSRTFVAWVVLN
ncbi:MAG TPA: hypothetical protein VFP66_06340 [Candidatus Limnocylindrales bacterium]|nr:hypothetical protein [Candidatus Limnocylindrales bacterium]